ncbi:MAG: hypothetical protein DLM69_07065, partial [Candidatus Chloroheliales bacterium]
MQQLTNRKVFTCLYVPTEPQAKYHKLANVLWPWAAYILVTLLLLRNLVPLIADHLPGKTDGWQNLWNIWWLRYALLDLHTNPFYSDYIYYPTHASLLFHTYAPLTGLLALPFTVLLGPLLTTNIVAVGSFVLTGISAYALGRTLGLGMFGAWLAGVVYSFCNPARWNYFGSGQAGQLMMLWMPLYLLCLVRATSPVESDSRLPGRWLLGGAVFLACNGFTDWQFLVYMLLFTACYILYLLWREGSWSARLMMIRNAALVVGGGLLILSPLIYASVREAITTSYAVRSFAETLGHSWDLTTYFTPNAVNPLWGGWAAAQHFPGNAYGEVVGVANSGYLPLILALIGLAVYRYQVWQWAAIGLLFAILALGPLLHINDADTFGSANVSIPLPYTLLLNIPFFNISRDPARFSLIAYLCVGLLAGFGWQAFSQRISLMKRSPLTRYLAILLITALIVAEFSTISYPTAAETVSPFYYQLGNDPAQYAILEVPIADKSLGEYNQALEYIHHKKLLGGQTARKPCHCFPMQTPVVQWFWNLSLPNANDIIAVSPPTIAPAILSYYNIHYIILWKWILTPRDYAKAQALVAAAMPGAKPVADDPAITAYMVPLTATTTLLPIALDDNWPEL